MVSTNNRISGQVRAVLVAAGLVMGLLAVQPWLWHVVRGRANELYERRSAARQAEDLRQRNVSIKQSLGGPQTYLDQVSMVVPPRSAMTQIVERLEQLGDQQRVTVDIGSIKEGAVVGKGKSAEGVQLVPVTVSVRADGVAEQLLAYMSLVERVPELAVLEGWSLVPAVARPVPSPLAVGAAPAYYTLTMDVTFFIQTHGSETAR